MITVPANKSRALIRALGTGSVLLLAVNAYVYWPSNTARPNAPSPRLPVSATDDGAEQAQRSEQNHPAQPSTARPPPFAWAPVASNVYKTYMANLGRLGFPDELIREIIAADINKLYAPREDALQLKRIPHDAPMSQRRRKPMPEDIQQMIELRAIEIEKQRVLQELLGV